MWRPFLTDLLVPMLLGAALTMSAYEMSRFYRRPMVAVRRVHRVYVRRTPTDQPPANVFTLRIPEQRQKGA